MVLEKFTMLHEAQLGNGKNYRLTIDCYLET